MYICIYIYIYYIMNIYIYIIHIYLYIHISGTHLRVEGGDLPCPFLKIGKSASIFGKKALIVSILGLNIPIFKVLRLSRGKSSKIFPCGAFFSCVFDERFMVSKVPQFHKNSPALKNLWLCVCMCLYIYINI